MEFKINIGKKGGIHVDWAISMGLFLVYVILLFIILRPGAYAEHKPESLFTIIETPFFNNTLVRIYEIQFSVKLCSEGNEVILKDTNSDSDYMFSQVVKKDGRPVILTKEGVQNELGVAVGGNVNMWCSTTSDGYEIIVPETNKDPRIFEATSYPSSQKTNDISSIPLYEITCDYNQGRAGFPRPAKPPCVARLGAITEYSGFYLDYLRKWSDKSNNLNQLKEDWGFPASKSFNIKIIQTIIDPISGVKRNEFIDIGDKVEPPNGISVFSKEFDATLLDKYNQREKIKVRIRVW